jgi:valyl-tRNA synthetase
MEGYRNFCNKIWNAARLVLSNCEGHSCAPAHGHEGLAERWISSRLQDTVASVHRGFANYRFDHVAQACYEFVWNEYCDWYLELAKATLYDDAVSAEQKQACRHTMLSVLEQWLRLLHPLMPFITEDIWQRVAPLLGRDGNSIMLQAFPQSAPELCDAAAETDFGWCRALILAIRQIRAEGNIGPGVRLNALLRHCEDSDRSRLQAYRPTLLRLARLDTLEILPAGDSAPAAATALAGNVEVLVPLAGLLDVATELARLDKELQRLAGERERLEAKLQNPSFANRAPADVVGKEREKLENAIQASEKLSEQRVRIAALGQA